MGPGPPVRGGTAPVRARSAGRLYDVFGAMVHGTEDGWRPAGDILTAAGLPTDLAS